MSTERTDLGATPVGRLVQGSVSQGKTTDYDGNALVFKTGANAGQPRSDFFFSVAIRKDDPGVNLLLQSIQAEARKCFPQFFDASGACLIPTFSWKFKDGDCQVPNENNVRNCDREGFAGCWVFSFSGSRAPGLSKRNEQGQVVPISDPSEIKKGYYIQVAADVSGNGNTKKPGVYLNHSLVLLAGYGEVIMSGPDAATAFAAPTALPAGASATPPAVVPQAAVAPQAAPIAAPAPTSLPAPTFTPPPVAAAPVPGFAPPPVAAAPVPGFVPGPIVF